MMSIILIIIIIIIRSAKEWPMKGNTGEADSAPYISIAYGALHLIQYKMI